MSEEFDPLMEVIGPSSRTHEADDFLGSWNPLLFVVASRESSLEIHVTSYPLPSIPGEEPESPQGQYTLSVLEMDRLPTLAVNGSTEVTLGEGGLALFRIDVPEGAECLHIETFDAASDVNLGLISLDAGVALTAAHAEITRHLDSHLVAGGESQTALATGEHILAVVSRHAELIPPFTLSLSLGTPTECPHDHWMPTHEGLEDLSTLERVTRACVVVRSDKTTGSGTVVHPDGLILTNFHVIGKVHGGDLHHFSDDDYRICFTERSDLHPRERFHARIVAESPELDLALLLITETVRGESVGLGSLPTVEMRDPEGLAEGESLISLGDPICILGYPTVGGLGVSVFPINLTKGVCSGFDIEDGRWPWVKTDALINSGNSGGTAVNEEGQLIGVPSIMVHKDRGCNPMSYIRPISAIPQAWWSLIEDPSPAREASWEVLALPATRP
jgi:S1-C subfamily serine protease